MSILGDLSAFSNPFGPSANGQWNLSRGIYTTTDRNNVTQSIVFFYELINPAETKGGYKTAVDQITDGGGRRLAVYKYPYIDGQQVKDLGREGETYSFNIKFHGQNYQSKLSEFLSVVLNSSGQGTLLHPVRSGTKSGSIKCRFHTYEFLHRGDEFNAVTIRATFIEDNTGDIQGLNKKSVSQDSALRTALQYLTTAQATIGTSIFQIQALLLLPASIANGMKQRLNSLTGQISRLLGQIAATFSTSKQIQNLAAQAIGVAEGIPGLSSGVAANQVLPPVYQNGFNPAAQVVINANLSSFINSNQITTQQAVFLANQARAAISAALAEVDLYFGNYGYDIMVLYRGLAVQIQESTQAAISAAQNQAIIYTVPYDMSLRMVAKLNGLTPDDSFRIENLNPYLPSVNLIAEGSQVLVPSS